jgi:hypothetical protein
MDPINRRIQVVNMDPLAGEMLFAPRRVAGQTRASRVN